MVTIRYAQPEDQKFWYQLDRHLPEQEFSHKVAGKTGYVLLEDSVPVGLLRYSLFWDSIPFCNMLYIAHDHQRKGYGKKLVAYWEADMKARGYERVLTSTQVNEEAQHFYRKLGYRDCGGFVIEVSEPMELVLVKTI